MMMEGGSRGSEKEKNLKGLMNEIMDKNIERSDRHAAGLKLHNRIMKLPMKELTEEVKWRGKEDSVLHVAAGSMRLPFAAIDRLVDAVGIDYKDKHGSPAIMHTALHAYCEGFEYLARNKKADLSIRAVGGINVYSIVGPSPGISQQDKEKMHRVLRDNGVTSANIIEGFRSPLSSIEDSLLLRKRLAQEADDVSFYIRAMTLSLVELAEEAKERRDDGDRQFVLMRITQCARWEAVVERIQRAWPGSVNAQSYSNEKDAVSPIIVAAVCGHVEHVRILATMGADLSFAISNSRNVFDATEQSPPEKKAAILKALSEHGVTSSNIPPRFQSPLYFRSTYYASNVRTQRWMNRKEVMLCVDSVYKWSLSNQIEDEKYRTLPADLSGVGRFIAHCWFDVAGDDNKLDSSKPDNGIARLIMSFAFGFDDSKSSFALIGMPEYGKVAETRTRCSSCDQHSKQELLQCCTSTRYCSVACQKANFKKHKKVCDRKTFLVKRAAVAARVAALRGQCHE
jgi:hypothetical protein